MLFIQAATTWAGVRSVLPLLEKKQYYKKLKHGYARGSEAVQYVDRIRTYHKVLNWDLNYNDQTEAKTMVQAKRLG